VSNPKSWPALLPRPQRYAALGAPYLVPVPTTPLPDVRLVHANAPLAAELGFDPAHLETPAFVNLMAGNAGWLDYPTVSSVYAGHQFGVYVPQLGDGRAHYLAELAVERNRRLELQLKGSGRTPWSRFGDGRAVLRSSIREYLVCEALHALGLPTTRALALVASSEPVRRERLETAAVVCRVAPSFVRFGHFEYFYYLDQPERLAPLADHVIAAHFPEYADRADRYQAWLGEVIERTARLMAAWQAAGFVHGVMNTDNFSILGLTLDYGPYGFMEAFDAHRVFNHTDETGRYAYDRQPLVGHWNCARLLQATLPLLDDRPERAVEIAGALLDRYPPAFNAQMMAHWRAKFGLREAQAQDRALINRFLDLLHRTHADFPRALRWLSQIRGDDETAPRLRDWIADPAAFDAWLADYRARLRAQGWDDAARAAAMNAVNPKYVLRIHLLQRAIARAENGDFSEVARLFELCRRPYDEHPGMEAYAEPPPAGAATVELSCSS
jgi:uncharacterized protein YdiU (UPF0061 family)